MEKRKTDRLFECKLSECGHPVACLGTDGTEIYCAWCEEIEQLREENDALRAQLEKQAIIVDGGEFHFDGKEIGFLEVRGGVTYLDIGRCYEGHSAPAIPDVAILGKITELCPTCHNFTARLIIVGLGDNRCQ